MKSFSEWLEAPKGTEPYPKDYKELPVIQQELIKYEREAEFYRNNLKQCMAFIREIIETLDNSWFGKGMSAKISEKYDMLRKKMKY